MEYLFKKNNFKRSVLFKTSLVVIVVIFAFGYTNHDSFGYVQSGLTTSTIDNSGVVTTVVAADSLSNKNLASPSSEKSNSGVPLNNASKLFLTLRDLWADHTGWTRNYIISFVAGLPDTTAVAERLFKNQQDIGNAIKPFYGSDAGIKLTNLLKDHITGAVDLLKAAKAGNTTATTIDEKKWYDNADQIATLLSSANPNWSKADLKKMLNDHLLLTKTEAVARLTNKYTKDISTYDKIRQEANMMSDALANGIIKQFPDKFI